MIKYTNTALHFFEITHWVTTLIGKQIMLVKFMQFHPEDFILIRVTKFTTFNTKECSFIVDLVNLAVGEGVKFFLYNLSDVCC